jgi:TIR domain/Pentapeptide repeats (8 copies)
MVNQEHLDILKQGVKVWNEWRKEHPDIRANLTGADLGRAYLKDADLKDADLSRADLSRANLHGADLTDAILTGAILTDANFTDANFFGAVLSRAYLSNAILTGATVGYTTFGYVDLSALKGLDTVRHIGPSTIGIDAIYHSQGKIPEIFLRNAGVQDTFITNMRALVDSMSPIDFYSCFISYSNRDEKFAERLFADLQSNNVRCWFAPEHMKTGDEIRERIDESIRLYDKLLLVLSEHSVESAWVKKEVETAFEKERQQNRLVLFPIQLDDTVKQTNRAWAADIRRMRHITDFTRWKNHDEYQKAFSRLLRDLKASSSDGERKTETDKE